MSGDELRIYNMLRNSDLSNEQKNDIKDNLINKNKMLFIALGVEGISYKTDEKDDIEERLTEVTVDYIEELTKKGNQDLRNIGEEFGKKVEDAMDDKKEDDKEV